MADQNSPYSAALHVRIDKQPADKAIQQADKANRPVIDRGNPCFCLLEIDVFDEFALVLKPISSEKGMGLQGGAIPDGRQGWLVRRLIGADYHVMIFHGLPEF